MPKAMLVSLVGLSVQYYSLVFFKRFRFLSVNNDVFLLLQNFLIKIRGLSTNKNSYCLS